MPEMVARMLGPRWCSTELSLLSGLRRGERMEEIGRGRDEFRRRATNGNLELFVSFSHKKRLFFLARKLQEEMAGMGFYSSFFRSIIHYVFENF